VKGLFVKKQPPVKAKRSRTVAPLSERYKDRPLVQEEKKKQADPGKPRVRVTRTQRFIIATEAFRNFPWMRLTITFLIILLGGVGSSAFAARNADVNREIGRAERVLRNYQNANFALEQHFHERHTFYEIERIAVERLGMTHPDPAQVFHINVPRIGEVTLNTAEYALPRHNYFWQESREFLGGLINEIFGG